MIKFFVKQTNFSIISIDNYLSGSVTNHIKNVRIKYIKGDKTLLEKEPLETISKNKQLAAFKYSGFWYCMDTARDKIVLDKLLKKKKFKKIFD